MRKSILFLLCLVFSYQVLIADWEQINAPQKGNIEKVVINRNENNIFYAVSWNKIYKTIDDGSNWYEILEYSYSSELFSIAPNNQNVIYTKEWKSIDGGESWIQISAIPGIAYLTNHQIAIDPTNSDIIFSSDNSGIYKTTNGGESWELIQNIHSSWSAYDDLDPSTMYSIGNDEVYKSTDNGDTWVEIFTLPSSPPYFSGNLIINNHDLYCLMGVYGNVNMIVKSEDEGLSWITINLDPTHNITMINDFYINDDIFYIATNKGLYSSDDDGSTWLKISGDYDYLESVDVSNKILIGSRNTGVSMSSISADDWKNIGIEPLFQSYTKIITSSNGVTLCNGNDGIYKFLPDIQNWRTIIPPIGSYISNIALSFSNQNANKVFAVLGDQLFSSESSGDDWEFIGELPSDISSNVISISSDDSKIFLKTSTSLLRTLNCGTSWSTRSIPGSNLYDVHYSDDNFLYILDDTGFYYSSNEGNTWISLDTNLPPEGSISGYGLYYDINDNDKLFCHIQITGPNGHQVYEKPSGIFEWSLIYTGIVNDQVPLINKKIVTDPNNSDLYGAGYILNDQWTFEYWLFHSTDNGISWEKCSDYFNFYSYSNYAFSNYDPFKMWYVDENSDFWLGDVQNMTGTGISPVEIITNNNLSIYPNPFNPSTTIKLNLAESGKIELAIYNIKGQKVKTLMDAYSSKGHFEIIWRGIDDNKKKVASGSYFIKLSINGIEKAVKKCVLLK